MKIFLAIFFVLIIISGEVFSQDKIYWSENGATPRISRANLNGGNVEIIADSLKNPYGIAIDNINNKIYWVDAGNGKIQRVNINGGQIEDIITGLNFPYGIAVYPETGKIFWTDRIAKKIQRADLDGSNVETIIDSGLTEPLDIKVDTMNQQIYFSDSENKLLQKANLDGSNLTAILFDPGNPCPSINGLTLRNTVPVLYMSYFDSCNYDGSIWRYDGNLSDITIPPFNYFPNFLFYNFSSFEYIYFSDSISDEILRWRLNTIYVDTLASINNPQGIVLLQSPLLNEETTAYDFLINITPNPIRNQFYIIGNFPLPATLELFDIFGRKAFTQQLIVNHQELDITNLTQGLYFFSLKTTGGKEQIGKIVVSK